MIHLMSHPTFLHECKSWPSIGNHEYHGLKFADSRCFVDAGFGECIRVDLVEACCLNGKSGFEYIHLLKEELTNEYYKTYPPRFPPARPA
jgi:hypothetical protein